MEVLAHIVSNTVFGLGTIAVWALAASLAFLLLVAIACVLIEGCRATWTMIAFPFRLAADLVRVRRGRRPRHFVFPE